MNTSPTSEGPVIPFNLPNELFIAILENLEDPADLLQLGLTSKSMWPRVSWQVYIASARMIQNIDADLSQEENQDNTVSSTVKSAVTHMIKNGAPLPSIETAVEAYKKVLGDDALNGTRGCWLGPQNVHLAPLLLAVQVGRLEVVDYLLGCGASLEVRQRHDFNNDVPNSRSHMSNGLEASMPDRGYRPHVECDGTQIIHDRCLNALDVAIITGQETMAIRLLDRGISTAGSNGPRISSFERAMWWERLPIVKEILARSKESITPCELPLTLRLMMTRPCFEGETEILDTLLDIEANNPQFSAQFSGMSLVNTALSFANHDFPCAGNALHVFARRVQQGRATQHNCLIALGESLKTVRRLPLAEAILAEFPRIVRLEGTSLLHQAIGYSTKDDTLILPAVMFLVDAGVNIDDTHLQHARKKKLWNVVELLATAVSANSALKLIAAA
ncbi:hypothetical protein F5X99DRAFT_428759 [Biscogniauxia marginata]|nr:hypothetical protein F5X99DRAFT_428759 [Biscogniauxia marginata]